MVVDARFAERGLAAIELFVMQKLFVPAIVRYMKKSRDSNSIEQNF